MSSWYAAHLVLYVKLKDRPQDKVTVWENVVLIHANSEEEAFEKATQRGQEEAGDEDGSFRWNGWPAAWVFAGVRKLTSCDDPEERPGDGSEITYTELQVDSEDSVRKLVNGESVTLSYCDRFAEETSDCSS